MPLFFVYLALSLAYLFLFFRSVVIAQWFRKKSLAQEKEKNLVLYLSLNVRYELNTLMIAQQFGASWIRSSLYFHVLKMQLK